MTKLIYRGKTYSQNKNNPKKQFVELTYRRNVYSNRQIKVDKSKQELLLTYRGINYHI